MGNTQQCLETFLVVTTEGGVYTTGNQWTREMPMMLPMSYKAQDSSHNKELSSPKCQQSMLRNPDLKGLDGSSHTEH